MVSKSLVIDASTIIFQAGILEGGRFSTFHSSSDDTLTGFFKLIKLFWDDHIFNEVIFCEGPGKLIGIRTTLMLTRVLKIIHPDISIYSYNTLELAHKIQNQPLEGNSNQNNHNNNKFGPSKIFGDNNTNDNNENIVCIRKNRRQYYIFHSNQIGLIEYETIPSIKNQIFRLEIQHNELPDNHLRSMKYNLKNYAHLFPSIIIPNEAVETAFDPENEHKKWEPIRHK